MVIYCRIEAECTTDLVLNKLPAEDAQTHYTLLELLLDRLVQMTANGIVSISLSQRDRLLVGELYLLNFLTEHVTHRGHIDRVVQEKQVGTEIFQHVCLVVEQVNVLLHEAEEG